MAAATASVPSTGCLYVGCEINLAADYCRRALLHGRCAVVAAIFGEGATAKTPTKARRHCLQCAAGKDRRAMSAHHTDWQILHHQTAGGCSQTSQLPIRKAIISRQITRWSRGSIQGLWGERCSHPQQARTSLALPSSNTRYLLQVIYCFRSPHRTVRTSLPLRRTFFAASRMFRPRVTDASDLAAATCAVGARKPVTFIEGSKSNPGLRGCWVS